MGNVIAGCSMGVFCTLIFLVALASTVDNWKTQTDVIAWFGGLTVFLVSSMGFYQLDKQHDEEQVAYWKAHDDEVKKLFDAGCKRSYLSQKVGATEVFTCPDGNQYRPEHK